jgi:hypothetical protein
MALLLSDNATPCDFPYPQLSGKSNSSGTMDRAVQPVRRCLHYERRCPEETTLYQVVQEHLETFLAQVELETGAGLPEFVQEELDAFLGCGILAHGLLRLRWTVPMRSLSPSPVRSVAFVPPAAPGAWRRRPPTGSITASPGYRCATGCCHFRSRCACCSPPIPSCSRQCCRSFTGSFPDF